MSFAFIFPKTLKLSDGAFIDIKTMRTFCSFKSAHFYSSGNGDNDIYKESVQNKSKFSGS